MASVVSISIDLSKIDKSRIVEGKNGAKYLDLNLSINDETNDYGKNVSVFHSQTKEEREGKVPRDYVGNGKLVWTDGKITMAESKKAPYPNKQKQSSGQLDF